MAAAAGAKAMPPIGGLPASFQPRRKRWASASASSKSPAIAAVVSSHSTARWSASRKKGSSLPLLRVATGGNEIAGGQEHHRCHVQGVRVLPRHLDVVGPWREQLEAAADGGDGCIQLAADEVHGGHLVERVALQAGVADPMGQLDGAFGQVGVRRVALVLQGGDGEHCRLDLGITAGQHPGLRQQRPLLAGGSSSDMTPGAFVITSAAVASSTAARRGSPARRAASAAAR